MLKANCVIAQSGGPTAVINSSLVGALTALYQSQAIGNIFGARNGILGLLKEDFINLDRVDPVVLQALRYTPGAALGSCRYQLKDEADYEKLLRTFYRHRVGYFIYIGGNDSMDTAWKVHQLAQREGYELRVIGVPKTVDNDLPATDHCPGYGSAAKYLATSVLETGIDLGCIDTSTKVAIVETMGRNTGWLAGATALARRRPGGAPHLIYMPEVPFELQSFLADVEAAYRRYGVVLVVVAEGLVDQKGNYIFNQATTVDDFGHRRLGGLSQLLLNQVEAELGIKGRCILPATSQRCATHLASQTDALEAYQVGWTAVTAATGGASGKMVTIKRLEGDDYACSYELVDLSKVANQEKRVPRRWINEAGNDVTGEFIEYARPLIAGEVEVTYQHGLPVYPDLETCTRPCYRERDLAI